MKEYIDIGMLCQHLSSGATAATSDQTLMEKTEGPQALYGVYIIQPWTAHRRTLRDASLMFTV